MVACIFLFLQIEGHVYSLRYEELKQMALQGCKQKLNLFRAQSSKFQLSKPFNYFLYIICIRASWHFEHNDEIKVVNYSSSRFMPKWCFAMAMRSHCSVKIDEQF